MPTELRPLPAPALATADRPAARHGGQALARAQARLDGQQVTLAADESQPAGPGWPWPAAGPRVAAGRGRGSL